MSEKIKQRIAEEAKALGFHSLGVTAIPVNLRREYYEQWIAEGKHGTMTWMERNNDRRLHPEKLIPEREAKSIIVIAFNYYQDDPDRNYRISKVCTRRRLS